MEDKSTGKEPRLTVLHRDQYGRRIVFECPKCQTPNEVAGLAITAVDDGKTVIVGCRQCGEQIDVTLDALGGYLWKPPAS